MAFISIPHCVKVTVEIDLNGKVVINRHYCFKVDETAITSDDCEDCADAIYDAYVDNWIPDMSDEGMLVGVDARDAEDQEGAFGQTTKVLPIAGDLAFDAVTNNVALVVTLQTSSTGRSGRGRVYLAGFIEDNVSDNKVDLQLALDAVACIVAIDDNLIPLNFRHRLASIYHNGVQRDPVLTRNIPSVTINSRVDTQRRRLPKV